MGFPGSWDPPQWRVAVGRACNVEEMYPADVNSLPMGRQWIVNPPAMSKPTPILLIEDDPAQRLLLAAYLRQAGFLVEEAETLVQGRALLATAHPHLVLLDLNLPGADPAGHSGAGRDLSAG